MRTYYGRSVLKRPVWKWYVPAYFFTGGVAAGSALLAAGGRLTGDDRMARRCLVTSSAAVAASGVLLVADLGRPARFLNMLRVAKPTSPMSVGTWLLSAFGTATSVATACELLDVLPAAGRVAEGVAATLAPAMATYTAVLVADTAVPAWHDARHELPFVFAGGAAASAGALAVLVSPGSGAARRLALGGAVVELAAAESIERRLDDDVRRSYHRGSAGLLGRISKASTATGIALLLVPGRVRWLRGHDRSIVHALGAGLVVAGAATERFAVFHAGVDSAGDPALTVGPQRRRLTRSAGRPRAPRRSGATA